MPPIYDLECEDCKCQTSVIRSFAEYETPPSDEETADVPPHPDKTPHKWKRIVQGKVTVVKGNGWGAGKGGW